MAERRRGSVLRHIVGVALTGVMVLGGTGGIALAQDASIGA